MKAHIEKILKAHKIGILKFVEKSYNIKIPKDCFTAENDVATNAIVELMRPMTDEELEKVLPKKKTHISDNKIMSCSMPHTGDSTCEGCNMTLKEMEEHNKKCLYETPEDKIYNQAIDDCLKALKGQIPAEQEEDWTMHAENIRLREALEKIASTNYDLREKIAVAKQALGDK